MNGQTNTASLTPNTSTNTDKFEWTCVSWYNKISTAVTNKSCHFLGVAVASFAGIFTFIPSLAVDLGYATKRLYDRKTNTPPNPIQNFMSSNGSEQGLDKDYPYSRKLFRADEDNDTYYSVTSEPTTRSNESDPPFKSVVQ